MNLAYQRVLPGICLVKTTPDPGQGRLRPVQRVLELSHVLPQGFPITAFWQSDHEGALALDRLDETFIPQHPVSATDRVQAVNLVFVHQLRDRRQGGFDGELAFADPFAEVVGDFLVSRCLRHDQYTKSSRGLSQVTIWLMPGVRVTTNLLDKCREGTATTSAGRPSTTSASLPTSPTPAGPAGKPTPAPRSRRRSRPPGTAHGHRRWPRDGPSGTPRPGTDRVPAPHPVRSRGQISASDRKPAMNC